MEINFSNQQGVQIVTLKGSLGQAEASAVRNKLEQKFNQGRTKILFNLTGYHVDDDTARSIIINILTFCINRGVLVACCGTAPEQWPFLVVPGNIQPKIFLSLEEGFAFLVAAKDPVLKPAELSPGEALAAATGTGTDAAAGDASKGGSGKPKEIGRAHV